MAGTLIGGAALGVPFNELATVLKNFGERVISFHPVLKETRSKVNDIIPLVKEIDDLNEAVECPKEEMENLRNLLEGAKKLLDKCPTLGKLDYLRKSSHTEKLRELNIKIGNFRDVILLQTARDGKKTLKLTSEIKDVVLRLDGKSVLSNPMDLIVTVPEIIEESVGLEKPVEKLKAKLFKDGVRLLVVTAPGGCGKSTLAIKFCHDKQVKNKFRRNIFFLTVSSKPDTKLILNSLIRSLRGPVSDSIRDDEAFRCLELLVGQSNPNPVLIVLDDVWEGSESNKLLEKFSRMPNCKILVTSRIKFPAFGESYDLEPLDHKDAKQLFHRLASLDSRMPQLPDEQTVEKIVRACKRFPLALKVIARSLSGRATSVWKITERKLSRGDSILGLCSEEELLECLKGTLDAIPDDKMVLKECFTDLGSFPEDQRIRAATFIDICAGLYEQDECEAMSNLDELFTRTLVNTVSLRNEHEDDYYSESYITQHDMLRELAVHLTKEQPIDQRTRLLVDINRNEFPKWWSGKEMQPVKARLLSITTDEMFSSYWPDMEAPEVEVLILNPGSKTYNLPEFMKRMNKMKALIIRGYRSFSTELKSDYQLINCLSRLERISLERISIPSFSDQNLKSLSHLKKLSFFMCKIDKAFTSFSTQISSVFPYLLEISIDFCNDLMALPVGLCEIVTLEKLSITNCHGLSSLPEEIGQLINLKFLRLRSCIHLEKLPESISRLRELVDLDISYCVGLTKLPDKIGNLQKLEKLNIRCCPNMHKLPDSLRKLKNLKKLGCEGEMAKWVNIVCPRLRNVVKEHKEEASLDFLLA